jgi:hypothetical protein
MREPLTYRAIFLLFTPGIAGSKGTSLCLMVLTVVLVLWPEPGATNSRRYANSAHYAPVDELVLDTTPQWNGTSSIGQLGGGHRAFGQTLSVSEPYTVLKTFTFFLEITTDVPVQFSAFVMEWNGNNTMGTVLWVSPPRVITNTSSTAFSFETGGLQLTAGRAYVLFVDTGDAPLVGAGAAIGVVSDDSFPEGELVHAFLEAPFGQLRSGLVVGLDAAFVAVFASPNLGGSFTGMTPTEGKVVCRSRTTKQKVKIRVLDGARVWDCEAAGLVVNPGDEVEMEISVSGLAD